jgi:hypothetical protein
MGHPSGVMEDPGNAGADPMGFFLWLMGFFGLTGIVSDPLGGVSGTTWGVIRVFDMVIWGLADPLGCKT